MPALPFQKGMFLPNVLVSGLFYNALFFSLCTYKQVNSPTIMMTTMQRYVITAGLYIRSAPVLYHVISFISTSIVKIM